MVVFLVCAVSVGVTEARTVSSGPSVLAQIETAAAAGRLTYETALLYKVRAIRSPHLLPEPFRSAAVATPIKCGTPIMMEAMQAAPSLSPAFRAELQEAAARITTDSVYETPSGHFLIHYDLDGVNKVPDDDIDSSGHPDFIEKLALYFDSSWSHEVDNLGWTPPPSDGIAGGDGRYDIYPTSIGLVYGFTIQDQPGPEPWNDYSSYILLNKSFLGFPGNDDPEGNQAGTMKVTVAHEFNHACQFADNPLHFHVTESWWQEISATWMEDVVYDTVNDNYNYLDEFFSLPQMSLFDGSIRKYGAFVLGKFIEESLDADIGRQAWEKMRWSAATPSLDSALMDAGSSFAAAYRTFAGWNYFTDTRDVGTHYYEEGARYPLVPITRTESNYPLGPKTGSQVQSMAADYIEFLPDPLGRDVVEFNFNGANGIPWQAAMWLIDSSGDAVERAIDLDPTTGNGTLYFGGLDSIAKGVLVAANVSLTPTEAGYQYSLSFLARADCNHNGFADIFDVLYLIDFVYGGGPQPVPFWEVGDLNCSGGIDILDLSVIIDYVLRGGATPCPSVD
jgi:hypothetical protein